MNRKRSNQAALPRVASPTADRRRWFPPKTVLAALGLLALVAAVYWPTLDNGFIWDDETYLENNVSLRSATGLYNIWFKLGAVPQYYPLVHTTFWIENHLWGLDPRGYHVVNLLLHAAAAVLVWRVLRVLELPGAWLAAAIFAVHPVHVETVAWVTERKNVLSCCLALGSIWSYFRFSPPRPDESRPGAPVATSHQWWFYSLSLVLYVLALFSKTVACSVPAVLLVVYWWKRGRFDWREAARLTPFFAVGLALASLTVWMEKVRVLAVGDEWDFSPADRLLIAGRALWFYAGKLVWPWPLIFFYPRWTIDDTAWWQYLYPLAALAVLVLLWSFRRRIGRGPLAAVLIFAGVLVPALGFFNVYPFRFSFVADHFQYHASIALIALGAAGIALAATRLNPRWGVVIAAGVVLVPLAIVAERRTPVYHDLESLYLDTIAQNPTSWNAHHNLGIVYEGRGEHEKAIEHHRAAVELDPAQARSRISLATALISTKRWDEAAEQLTKAIDSQPDDYDRSHALAYLGSVQMAQRRFNEALASFQEAIQLMPNNWTALSLYAQALWARGQHAAAITYQTQALRLSPDDSQGQHQLGQMLLATSRPGEALAPLTRAVELSPADASYRCDLGIAQFQAGDLAAAEQQIRASLDLNPQIAKAHNVLGAIYGSRNDVTGAIAEFRAALRIDPQNADAQNNLKNALEAAQKPPAN